MSISCDKNVHEIYTKICSRVYVSRGFYVLFHSSLTEIYVKDHIYIYTSMKLKL